MTNTSGAAAGGGAELAAQAGLVDRPDLIDGYRASVRGAARGDTVRLVEIGHRLLAIGTVRTAVAVMVLAGRCATAETKGVVRNLASAIAGADFPESAIRRLTPYLRPTGSETDPARAEQGFIAFLIEATVRFPTPARLSRLLALMDGRQIQIDHANRLAPVATKLLHPSAVTMTRMVVEDQMARPDVPEDELWLAMRYHLYAHWQIRGAEDMARYAGILAGAEPRWRTVYDDGFRSMVHFARGETAEAVEAARGRPLKGHGRVVANGLRLYPRSDDVARWIAQIALDEGAQPPEVPDGLIVRVACDPIYLERFGEAYVRSFVPRGRGRTDIAFLVSGAPDPALLDRIKQASAVPVTFEIDPREAPDTAYHTIRRYRGLAADLQRAGIVVATDIDATVNLSDPAFEQWTTDADAGWVDAGGEVPWLRNNAGIAFFQATRHGIWAARVLETLIDHLYRPRNDMANWYVDQVCLAVLASLAAPDGREPFSHRSLEALEAVYRPYISMASDVRNRLIHKTKSMSARKIGG